jgi:uncharacterized phiE125 gp8 family phage protein
MLIPLAAPTTLVVTLAEAKSWLKVEHAEKDEDIGDLVAAATAFVGGEAELTLAPTVFEQRLDGWPTGCVELDAGPVRSVDEIIYLDEAGDEQSLDAGEWDWEPTGLGARVWLTTAATRPRLADRPGGVRILFAAGFNDPAASDGNDRLKLPDQVKTTIRLLVAHWWRNRETVVLGASPASLPFGVDAMITNLRVYR